jgi:hypothetical protein
MERKHCAQLDRQNHNKCEDEVLAKIQKIWLEMQAMKQGIIDNTKVGAEEEECSKTEIVDQDSSVERAGNDQVVSISSQLGLDHLECQTESGGSLFRMHQAKQRANFVD